MIILIKRFDPRLFKEEGIQENQTENQLNYQKYIVHCFCLSLVLYISFSVVIIHVCGPQ